MNKKNKTIWILDDDDGILDVTKIVLEEEGYTVEAIQTEEIFLKKIAQSQPHLLLLDVMISGSDGKTICLNLKNDEKTKSLPVVMMSADNKIIEIAKEAQANDYIVKPFDIDYLIKKVADWV